MEKTSMTCAKCDQKVDFDVQGGLCIDHWVEWSLSDYNLSEDDYAKEFETQRKYALIGLHFGHIADELAAMGKAGELDFYFEGSPTLYLVKAMLDSYLDDLKNYECEHNKAKEDEPKN